MPRKPRTPEQKAREKELVAIRAANAKAAKAEPAPKIVDPLLTAAPPPKLADDMPPPPLLPGPPPGVDTWTPIRPVSNLTYEEAQEVAWRLLQSKCEIIWQAKAYRQGIDTIEKLLVCLMRGAEIGIPPVQAATSIYLSRDGMPGMSAELMVACVLRSGIGTIEYGTLDDMTAQVRGVRYGVKGRQDTVLATEVTLDDLRATGWVPEPGFLPRDTLRARAISRLCRAFFADVLGGVSYSPDEIREIDANAERRTPVGKPSGLPPIKTVPVASKSEAKRLAAQRGEPMENDLQGNAAPDGPQEPRKAPVKATPSPKAEPASPPAAAPTEAIPDTTKAYLPERAMVRVYQVPGANGEPQPLHTAGITLDQLRQVGELAQVDPTLVPRAKEWMTERNILSSKHLYESEGDALLAFMRSQQAFPNLSIDRAITELDEEIERQGLTDIRDAVYQYLAVKGDDPHDHLRAADDLRKQGDDPAALRLALTQMQALG